MKELVSVIIPTYNRSGFVTQAIDSVLEQTYDNIEIIVVNDGSEDDTEEKLQPYTSKIKYIPKENGGVVSALNAALAVASGKYIARLDDDDLFMPEKIEKQADYLRENPDVGLVTCGCFIIDSAGRITSVKESPEFPKYGPFISSILEYSIIQPTVMVRRQCHEELGVYRGKCGEDYDMFLRIMRHWKVGTVNLPLAKYRRHEGNMTRDLFDNEPFLREVSILIRDILDNTPLEELFPSVTSRSTPYQISCAYAAKGALYLSHRVFGKAEENFLKALDIYPSNSIPLIWLGISARTQEDYEIVDNHFSRISKDDDLYSIAQGSRDLTTTIQRSRNKKSYLLARDITREQDRFFGITFRRISGTGEKEKVSSRPASEALKLSRYAVVIDNYPQGSHLLFNTFTHGMICIGDELKSLIEGPIYSADQSSLKDVRVLKKMGMLVNQEFDETEMIKKWYNDVRGDLSRVRAVILTTYDCNFACPYCVEQGVKKPVYMDDECADSLADWLMNRMEAHRTKELTLLFYGGEPLLNTRPIYRISEKLYKFITEEGLVLSSSITTNGSLLDGNMLRDLTKFGLRSVKVTIDGTREVHDQRRCFKSGRGSFDVIMENIQEIPDTVKLDIQTNLDAVCLSIEK